MTNTPTGTLPAVAVLTRHFLLDHPGRAAMKLEEIPISDAAAMLAEHPTTVLVPVILKLAPDAASALILKLPIVQATSLLAEMPPNDAIRFLNSFADDRAREYLDAMDSGVADEIERLSRYPADSAGQLMESRTPQFRGSTTVEETLNRLRQTRAQANRSLFVIDDDNKLCGRVSIQDIAVAPPGTRLQDLVTPVSAVVSPVSPRAEVVELLDRHKLIDLAVTDIDGRLLGIVYNRALIQAIQEDATADIQTMVGASKDERALSTSMFAVRKRQPWLQINLLTAFLAASVVALFEQTIAMFTALAVLLPVVAGQSGNAGAQALAVTMRGLALREISLRHWWQVTFKELRAGFVNGLAIAITCGIGVYIWSGSLGLVIVIAVSMVLAMVVAGFAGAVVPIILTRLGQDPAQSSSIILTTVTDVAGFFSFLGIATLLASML